MADRVKQARELKIVARFVDGDDRTIAIPDPKADIDEAQVRAFGTASAKVLEGDKTAAAFKDIKSAKIFETTTTYLDLTKPA